jgi:hypothetical protein
MAATRVTQRNWHAGQPNCLSVKEDFSQRKKVAFIAPQ